MVKGRNGPVSAHHLLVPHFAKSQPLEGTPLPVLRFTVMASPRTVSLTVLLQTKPLGLLHPAPPPNDPTAEILRACPDAKSILDGLRDGGWRLGGPPDSTAEHQGLSVSFIKQFVGSTPIDACEDARRCGVTDELAPIFDWAPDRGDDDDGAWDYWHGEL
jgi:hypothetical protein